MMNHSLASKNQTLALIIVLIVSLFLLFPASVLFFNYRSSVIEEMSEHATIDASMTAHIVEQTIDDYRKLSETPDFAENPYDEAYYLRMNRLFAQLKAETGAEYIYTERRVGEESIEYILDAEIPDSENFSPIGVPDYLSEPEKKYTKRERPSPAGSKTMRDGGNTSQDMRPSSMQEMDL